MINPNIAWELIRRNALKAKATQMIWHTLVHGNAYRIENVLNDKIIIYRAEGKLQELTEETIRNAAIVFNNNNCCVQRRHLISPTVAEETAFVLFHPQLGWDEEGNYIIEI